MYKYIVQALVISEGRVLRRPSGRESSC